MNKIFKNLTGHDINISEKDGNIVLIPAENYRARLSQKITRLGEINGIELIRSDLSGPVLLPEKEEGTILIVSNLVAEYCVNRDDLVYVGEFINNFSIDNQKTTYAKKLLSCKKLADKLLLLK